MSERDSTAQAPNQQRKSKLINLTGQQFGKWTVIEIGPRAVSGGTRWLCECECSRRFLVEAGSLRGGGTKCCKHCRKRRHGMSHTRTHNTWSRMIDRCSNPRNRVYSYYGGRGIAVCERWLVFEKFLDDMGEHPVGLSIDRINNDKGYEPGNCRWADKHQQAQNTRQVVHLTMGGVTRCLTEWERVTGLSRSAIRKRLKSGMSVETALTTPKRNNQWDSVGTK